MYEGTTAYLNKKSEYRVIASRCREKGHMSRRTYEYRRRFLRGVNAPSDNPSRPPEFFQGVAVRFSLRNAFSLRHGFVPLKDCRFMRSGVCQRVAELCKRIVSFIPPLKACAYFSTRARVVSFLRSSSTNFNLLSNF